MSRLIREAALAVLAADGADRHGIDGEQRGEHERDREHFGCAQADMAVTDPRTPVEAKEALDAFKRSSKPKRTGKPDAIEDVTEMPETIDMAEDEKQADW